MNQSIRLKLEDILSRAKKSAEQAEVFFRPWMTHRSSSRPIV